MSIRTTENNTSRDQAASCHWGPDIASNADGYSAWQGAGWVDGLLYVSDSAASGNQFPMMDRMGNITGYHLPARPKKSPQWVPVLTTK